MGEEEEDSQAEPWFYVDGAGARQGPHNFRVIRAQLRCNVLHSSTLVRQHPWAAPPGLSTSPASPSRMCHPSPIILPISYARALRAPFAPTFLK